MRIALRVHPDDERAVAEGLRRAFPGADVRDAAELTGRADYVVAGVRDDALFERLARPKAIFGMGAGVNGLLRLSRLPDGVPIVRLEDSGMAAQMVRYVVAVALRQCVRFDAYARCQCARQWTQLPPRAPSDMNVGVLGLGVIGGAIADALAAQGFRVRGHARGPQRRAGVECFAGDDGLVPFLTGLDLLAVVVPLTPATEGIVDGRRLALLADGAHLVNVGRGALVVDADVIAALDAGKLGHATLDVFAQEPLPDTHPYWTRDDVTVTPHIAGVTIVDEAVRQIAGKIRRLEAGLPVTGVVDRARGY